MRFAGGLGFLGSGRGRAGRCSPSQHGQGRAQGRHTCLEHMVLQAPRASREAQCEQQLPVPARPGCSSVIPIIPILTWEDKGQEIPAESPWPLGKKGFLQHPGMACKQ